MRRRILGLFTAVLFVSGIVPVVAAIPQWYGNNPSPAATLGIAATPMGHGYYTFDIQGGVFTHGDARYHGSVPELRRTNPAIGPALAVDLAPTLTDGGYWVLDEAGGIFGFGDAPFLGSVPGLRNAGIAIGPGLLIDLAPVGTRGYYLMDEQGGVFTFGNLAFHGSIPGLREQGVPIGPADPVEIAPRGPAGYWMLDSTGGVFSFGDAPFFGSLPQRGVQARAVAMASAPGGNGYWILDEGGGVHAFGNAESFGSASALLGGVPAVGLSASPDGSGYWVVAADGRVFAFGIASGETRAPLDSPPANPPPPTGNTATFGDSTAEVPWCQGDTTRQSASYADGRVVLTVDAVCPSNPHTDHRWIDGLSGVLFGLNMDDNDDDAEYFVDIFNFNDTGYSYRVERASDEAVTCTAGANWDGSSLFAASFSDNCIDDPSSFEFASIMFWDEDPYDDGSFDIDIAPDSGAFLGPVTRP